MPTLTNPRRGKQFCKSTVRLGQKHLYPIVRATVLTAFLGYILVSVGLMYDLGKPYNIWHPLIMYNPHSVMFEVAATISNSIQSGRASWGSTSKCRSLE